MIFPLPIPSPILQLVTIIIAKLYIIHVTNTISISLPNPYYITVKYPNPNTTATYMTVNDMVFKIM